MTRKSELKIILAAIAIAISVGPAGEGSSPAVTSASWTRPAERTNRSLSRSEIRSSTTRCSRPVSVPELITGPVPVTAEILTQAVVSDQVIEVDGITGTAGPKPAGREEPWRVPTRE